MSALPGLVGAVYTLIRIPARAEGAPVALAAGAGALATQVEAAALGLGTAVEAHIGINTGLPLTPAAAHTHPLLGAAPVEAASARLGHPVLAHIGVFTGAQRTPLALLTGAHLLAGAVEPAGHTLAGAIHTHIGIGTGRPGPPAAIGTGPALAATGVEPTGALFLAAVEAVGHRLAGAPVTPGAVGTHPHALAQPFVAGLDLLGRVATHIGIGTLTAGEPLAVGAHLEALTAAVGAAGHCAIGPVGAHIRVGTLAPGRPAVGPASARLHSVFVETAGPRLLIARGTIPRRLAGPPLAPVAQGAGAGGLASIPFAAGAAIGAPVNTLIGIGTHAPNTPDAVGRAGARLLAPAVLAAATLLLGTRLTLGHPALAPGIPLTLNALAVPNPGCAVARILFKGAIGTGIGIFAGPPHAPGAGRTGAQLAAPPVEATGTLLIDARGAGKRRVRRRIPRARVALATP